MKELLTAQHIFKDYGDLNVLSDISLSVDHHEVIAIVGPSGAGKTSLLHILGTLDKPKNNFNTQIIINETEITSLSDKKLAKFRNQNMGFIFQFHELLPEFTALENVCIPCWLGGSFTNESKNKAIKLLKRLGIADRALHKPSALSGGEQQRVAVAEPSGNLDSENADRLHDLFFELRDELRCSFVIVTHNKDLAMRADRIISLIDGKIKV